MFRLNAVVRVATLVLIEAGAVVSLATIGRRPELRVPLGHLGPWLRRGDAAIVTVASLRVVALLVAGWLLLSTLLSLAASLWRLPALVRAARWTTPPAVRRTVERVGAVSIAASVVLAPTLAVARRSGDPPAVSPVRDGRGGPLARLPADTTTTPAPAAPRPAPSGPTPVDAVDEVVVRAGDNLWMLAAVRLARTSNRVPWEVPDAEVAPYWARVCEANRDRLQSHDPDLVYPGETVVLPPIT